ncbi:hypothetical protein PFMALIP_04373 [Plasmodium falciparum MaliPS096_E11]|uniref:Uncharacterized protein n=1 Tax=Plasmodium falciparum MaliPS096_E11 TaxID=1036727 RepID=A0A024WLE9_PLAFA|nr:hypothetical protein PFMALIP_04373 [Plasmodium falciparum MaliPS096_E11]
MMMSQSNKKKITQIHNEKKRKEKNIYMYNKKNVHSQGGNNSNRDVESLIEILKYSSDSMDYTNKEYDDAKMCDDNFYDDTKLCDHNFYGDTKLCDDNFYDDTNLCDHNFYGDTKFCDDNFYDDTKLCDDNFYNKYYSRSNIPFRKKKP